MRLPTVREYFATNEIPVFPYWRPNSRYIAHIDCAYAEIVTNDKNEAKSYFEAHSELYVQNIKHNPKVGDFDYRVFLTKHCEGNPNFDVGKMFIN